MNSNAMNAKLNKVFTAGMICAGLLAGCISQSAQAQQGRRNGKTAEELGTISPVAPLNKGIWLKGDLHVHSRHSKESSNHPITKILTYAQSVGFGFIAITDHDNHVQGDVAHNTWVDPELKSDSILLLYGAEWTTVRGHGNTLSAKPYDHQRFYDVRDQRDSVIGRAKNELGIHLSANHPSGPKDHFGYSYDIVNSMEVWNSSVWTRNVNAILIWDDMLSSGRRITGRGGSDSHHGTPEGAEKASPNTAQAKHSYIGTPTTWVFAATRTSQAVIDALTNGRVSVSANPYAPRVEFYADLDEDGKMDMMMGDNAKATGKQVKFRIQLSGEVRRDSAYTVKVVKNGNTFGTYQLTMSGDTPVAEFTDTPGTNGRTYYRVTVEGPATPYPQVPGSMALSGSMVALSNPIYFNFDPKF